MFLLMIKLRLVKVMGILTESKVIIIFGPGDFLLRK